ncbi:MAG TPA: MlaD family protein [Gemmatimonadales bacterium]|nr:MlaD family protein [Gemmatimonadales bacterium]
MKRSNEFVVGLSVIAALALVVAAALWLSETRLYNKTLTYTARFRTVDGLGVGAPVTLRGVKVGRAETIRLAPDGWVETDFTIQRDVHLPDKPAVIAASASLFGEWSATIIPLEPLPDDPNVRAELLAAVAAGGNELPGATLPDVGQLTAQASRIASDIADLTSRVQGAFDSNAVKDMRRSILHLAEISDRLVKFADTQTGRLDRVSNNLATTTDAFAGATQNYQRVAQRVDSATSAGQLQDVMRNAQASSADLRAAAADLRSVMDAARNNQASLIRVVQSADSLMQRIEAGQGTLGMLATDSSLYRETTMTMRQMRQLLTDIQAHPRKYIKISVF